MIDFKRLVKPPESPPNAALLTGEAAEARQKVCFCEFAVITVKQVFSPALPSASGGVFFAAVAESGEVC